MSLKKPTNNELLYQMAVRLTEHTQEDAKNFKEIRDCFKDLKKTFELHEEETKLFRDHLSGLIGSLSNKVDKTNGKVMANTAWRYTMVGGMTVLSLVVLPILAWALWEIVNLDQNIQSSVERTLQKYEVVIEN